jgi:hypothetical protein
MIAFALYAAACFAGMTAVMYGSAMAARWLDARDAGEIVEIAAIDTPRPAVGPTTIAAKMWLEQSTRGLDDDAIVTIDGKRSIAAHLIRRFLAELEIAAIDTPKPAVGPATRDALKVIEYKLRSNMDLVAANGTVFVPVEIDDPKAFLAELEADA